MSLKVEYNGSGKVYTLFSKAELQMAELFMLKSEKGSFAMITMFRLLLTSKYQPSEVRLY